MPLHNESVTTTAVSKDALVEVLPPRDLPSMPRRVLTFSCAGGAGKLGLQAAKVQVGPTESGPWIDEDISATSIESLAAGSSDAYRMDRVDRFVRVLARGASGEGQTDLTVYLDASGGY